MLVKSLIVFCVFLLIVAVCVLIYLLLKDNTNKTKPVNKITPIKEEMVLTIEKLEELASDKNLSKNELFDLVKVFTDKFSIPAKKDKSVPKEANNYINFIILICSHKNADAKLISFLDKEVKKKNPSYITEIEDSEKIGIENRKNRR